MCNLFLRRPLLPSKSVSCEKHACLSIAIPPGAKLFSMNFLPRPCAFLHALFLLACMEIHDIGQMHSVAYGFKIDHMCGRYVMNHRPRQLEEFYNASFVPDTGMHFNIAPGSRILVLRDRAEERTGEIMRWGLVPSWVQDPGSLPMLHNARSETIAEKPMFRHALRKQRCLIPASGFYEWKAVSGQRSKQPFYISLKDGAPMSFAGLWESTRMPDGSVLESCTIITTEANTMLAPIHNRMPVLLDHNDWSLWLDSAPLQQEQLKALLKPLIADNIQVWGVSHAVNKAGNDSSALIEPIA